jgi:hypothetical protein
MFHGSYQPDDVIFLMRIINLEETPVDQKERLIQSKKFHYSEMISPEYRPDQKYLDLFYQAMEMNINRVTNDLLALARYYSELTKPVIVSLARAGTPVGVIVKRMLARFFNVDIPHYSISIIKDRGIDEAALLHILKEHPNSTIAFLDGWVSKGSIAGELKKSVTVFNQTYGYNLDGHLHALSDISGNAYAAVTNDDYLIPSAILNSVISGLISRSIYTAELAADGGYHGCKYYHELSDMDLSLWYVEQIMSRADEFYEKNTSGMLIGGQPLLKEKISRFLNIFSGENDIQNQERIKPGIGEATRAVLRREPKFVLVQDFSLQDVQHILHLCEQRNVDVRLYRELPFKAMAIL